MSNQSEPWSVEEFRRYQSQQQQGEEPTRGSNDSEISQELNQPTGFAFAGQGNLASSNGAAVQEADEAPPAKRPRKMMIRYLEINSNVEQSFRHALNWGAVYMVVK